MEQRALTHVRLLVKEYTACFQFYRDILGCDPTFGDAESGYADFDTGEVTLALFAAEEMTDALDETPPSGDGRDRVCVVLRVEDVDATATELRTEGFELAAGPTDHPEWGLRTVHVRDPDGTLVEFNEPLET
jgi:catechol 2,3-dioxygenase-like lactoylglutathione lyase family enzyme